MFDIIIIGGGISGLNTYRELVKSGYNKDSILLLEKEDYYGGRIRYWEGNVLGIDYKFPEGAARFNKSHINLISLLREFNLLDFRKDKGMIPYTEFIDSKNMFKGYDKYENGYIFVDKIINESKRYKDIDLKGMSFKELGEILLKKNDLDYMLMSCGYSGQLNNMNAYDCIKLFKRDIRVDIEFLGGKYDILIEEMIKSMKGYNMRTGCNVRNILRDNNKYKLIVNNKNVYSKRLIFCVPKESLLRFKILNPIREILERSITTKPLCRLYAIFKKEDIWFKDIKKKIVTNNDLRYIIPMDAEKGLIMISYTDDKYTKKWVGMSDNDKKIKIVRDVKKVFGIDINKPYKVIECNWKSGVGYWNKGIDSDLCYELLLNPLENIYICGENYSKRQSWVEGALESSLDCIKKIH